MVEYTMQTIRGDWMENGYLQRRGWLPIEIGDNGSMRDPHTGEALRLTQYGNDCALIGNGCWAFAPDTFEITRLNLKIEAG